MLKSLQLRHFLTESNFIWQLDVTGFSKCVKFQIKIPSGCWENSKKL